ncbi:MAG: ROK family protein [Crocinitomicaceae bacterium]|nr:ROK family protein [Flavobacteriales bacterium]NQZ37780.1 ROK family protein [Crocinitomicaceae bacterium]
MTSNTTHTEIALGVDIGGTNTAFGLCDKNGSISHEASFPTTDFETAEELVEAIYNHLKERDLVESILGIGIGAPNANYYSGNIEFAPNLSWKGVTPIAQLFERKFDLPTLLTNDANAAAIGEMVYGNARDLSHFVTITLGTGLGSGIIIDGNLVYGHDGFAGEYGHIQVVPDGRSCGCGRNGCLETYASATGVVRSITELSSHQKESSKLMERDDIQAHEVFDFAKAGDPFAKEIIDFTASTLGKALANFSCFSSPQAYVLFGGIAQSGLEFASLVKNHMEEHMLSIYKNKIDVRISSLHDKNAAVLGAASLVWNERKKYQ